MSDLRERQIPDPGLVPRLIVMAAAVIIGVWLVRNGTAMLQDLAGFAHLAPHVVPSR